MCFGGSSSPPPPPPPPPVQNALPQEDMSPDIEIAGDEGMGADESLNIKKKTGTKVLNTAVSTGSISGAGLEIPN